MTKESLRPELVKFRLELFSRGGDPRAPRERVFELPCPGLPADARVFGVIRAGQPDVSSTIASLVRNAIVSAESISKRTLNSGLDGRFEALLLAINRGYAELVASGTLPSSPLPDALIGMIVGRELFLSGRGAIEAYLFSGKTEPKNLFAEADREPAAPVLFQTILSGTIQPTDVALVSGSNIFDYLSIQHFSRVLKENPAREALTRALELLGDVPATVSISGIIIGCQRSETEKQQKIQPTESVGETKTELRSLARVKRFGGLITSGVKISAAAGGKVAYRGGKAIFTGGFGGFKTLLDKNRRQEVFARFKQWPARGAERWNSLSKRSQILLIALVLLVIVLGEGLRFLVRNRVAQEKLAAYNNQISAVQAARDAAEASLIYEDEDRAWQQLQDAERLISSLPQTTETEKRATEELKKQIETDKEKLRHVVTLNALQTTAELPANSGGAISVIAGKNIVTIVSDLGGVWNWDMAKRSLSPAIAPFLVEGNIKQTFSTARGVEYYTGKAVLERVATSTVKTPITLPTGAEADAANFWNGKLYVLAPTAKQIYKGSKSGSSWNLNQTALKNALDFRAAGFVIDGSIWVVGEDKIKNYLSGVEQAFAVKRIDPEPKNLSRVWTNAKSEYLFVYDSTLKRLFLLTKTGEFKKQYIGGPIDNLRDLAFDEKTKTLWFLDSKALYKTDLP